MQPFTSAVTTNQVVAGKVTVKYTVRIVAKETSDASCYPVISAAGAILLKEQNQSMTHFITQLDCYSSMEKSRR